MWTWQFAKPYFIAAHKGCEKFTSTQTPYNLLYREEEREVIPFRKICDIGYMVYSPTAVDVLSGRFYRDGKPAVSPDAPDRLKPETGFYTYKAYIEPPENAEIVRGVSELAESKSVKPSQRALA